MTYAIRWGIKQSFRQYLLSIDDACERFANGASLGVDGQYVFPSEDPTSTLSSGPLRCRGSVTIDAHRGLLGLRIRDPWIEGSAESLRLTVLHPGVRGDTDLRADLAMLEPRGEGRYAAMLTVAGSRAFDGIYPVGTRVDDVHLVPLSSEAGDS